MGDFVIAGHIQVSIDNCKSLKHLNITHQQCHEAIVGRVSEIVQVPPKITGCSSQGTGDSDMPTGVYIVVDRFTLGPQHTQLGMPTLHRPIEQQPILLQAAVSPLRLSTHHVVCLIYHIASAYAGERAA